MNPCFPPLYHQAGLGSPPSFSSNSHQMNNPTPLPYPLVPTDASGTRLSPEGLAHHSQTPTEVETKETGKKHHKSSQVPDLRPRKRCQRCGKPVLVSEFGRHPRRCTQNPDRVEVKCPLCARILSREDSLKRHLRYACPNRPRANPAPTSRLGPSRAARKKHRTTPYTPSPPSSASPQTPVDRLLPLTSPSNKAPHLPYTSNHYALYHLRQTAQSLPPLQSPSIPPLLHNYSPLIPSNFPNSSLSIAYGRNDLASPSQHAPIAQISSEYWLNAPATAAPSYGGDLTWPPTGPALKALPGRDESSASTPADGQLANGWCDSPPVESLDFQATPSTLANQEEYFLPFDYDPGDRAQYQGAAPQSAQEYDYFSGQPMFDESQLGLATFHPGPSQPWTMLEELESSFIVGDNVNDMGGQANTGYGNYPQFTDPLPTFQDVPTPTPGADYDGTQCMSEAMSAVTISDQDIEAIGSTVTGALRTSMEAPVILELARILASTGQPEGSF